ncbi:(2Fe-2S)-binding protein [Streptomyces sp. NPDC055632]
MPGVTDVVTVSTGVAVRGRTFGRCVDAVRALRVDWDPGTAEGVSEATVLAKLRRAELPLVVPPPPLLTKAADARCTSHLNGRESTPCVVPVEDLAPTDEVTTVEGLPDKVGSEPHPMREAWLDLDVAQCGYCRPGQIMTAVATVRRAREAGREVTEADLDALRDICRCGAHHRIRQAVPEGARRMP